MLREIVELRAIAQEQYGSLDRIDYAEGIYQAIGFKEFADLELPKDDLSRDPLYKRGLDTTKLRTTKYAKKQIKWINSQLLPVVREARALDGDVHLYVLHGGEKDEGLARTILGCQCKATLWHRS